MWAILADPTRRGSRWDLSEFLATGETEIDTVMSHISSLGVRIDFSGVAFDFGCGIGRLTQALGRRFAKCIGVDISATMIEKAEALNPDPEKCGFHVNRSPSLEMFADDSFSFIYSNIVLQHMSPHYAGRYIREFVRVLRPSGVLVFQTSDSIRGPLLTRLRARIRFRTGLMSLFRTAPMAMHFFPEGQVRKLLGGVRLVEVSFTNACQKNFNGVLAFAQHGPTEGYISKAYIVSKDRN